MNNYRMSRARVDAARRFGGAAVVKTREQELAEEATRKKELPKIMKGQSLGQRAKSIKERLHAGMDRAAAKLDEMERLGQEGVERIELFADAQIADVKEMLTAIGDINDPTSGGGESSGTASGPVGIVSGQTDRT